MSGAAAGALFTSSITWRRFPALRGLTEDDVEVMALPPRPTADRKPMQAGGGKGNCHLDPGLIGHVQRIADVPSYACSVEWGVGRVLTLVAPPKRCVLPGSATLSPACG